MKKKHGWNRADPIRTPTTVDLFVGVRFLSKII
jgi:hypothetical protein